MQVVASMSHKTNVTWNQPVWSSRRPARLGVIGGSKVASAGTRDCQAGCWGVLGGHEFGGLPHIQVQVRVDLRKWQKRPAEKAFSDF